MFERLGNLVAWLIFLLPTTLILLYAAVFILDSFPDYVFQHDGRTVSLKASLAYGTGWLTIPLVLLTVLGYCIEYIFWGGIRFLPWKPLPKKES